MDRGRSGPDSGSTRAALAGQHSNFHCPNYWVNMPAAQDAAILAQVGHFRFGAVGQIYVGAERLGATLQRQVNPRPGRGRQCPRDRPSLQ